MRLESVHPGFTVDQVLEATGFDLPVADGAGETPAPSDSELRAIREKLDPDGQAPAGQSPMSKVCALEELVDVIEPGMSVSFGGFAHSLTPMAVVRELVRRKVDGLVLVGIAEAWAADMLAGAGALRRLVFSNFMFEGFGLCRNFSRAIETGTVEFEDYSHFALASRFRPPGSGCRLPPYGRWPARISSAERTATSALPIRSWSRRSAVAPSCSFRPSRPTSS